MNIIKTDPVACARLIAAKKRAIGNEIRLHQSETEGDLPPKSEDLEAVSALADLSEVFVLSQFADRSDMEIAAHLIGSRASDGQVQAIILQSTKERYKLDADLTTIEAIQGYCVKFHTILMDETDVDQDPLVVFGVMRPEKGYIYSPDYAMDILHKAQDKTRAKQEAKTVPAKDTRSASIFRSQWRVS